MTAKPGCHNDSLWKDVKGEEEGEERVGRCTDVSLAPPSDAGRMKSSSCWRKTGRRLGFDKLFVILSVLLCIFLSPCFLAIIYSFQASLFSLSSPLLFPSRLLYCSSIFQHPGTPFSCLLVSYFFSLSPLLLPMSVVVSCVLLRQIKCSIHLLSSVLQRTVNVRSLPSSVSSPLYHRRADQIGTGPSHSVEDK